jgi:hypothetical protein
MEDRSNRPPRSSLPIPGRRRDLGRLRTRRWIAHIGSAACRARRHTATGSVGKAYEQAGEGSAAIGPVAVVDLVQGCPNPADTVDQRLSSWARFASPKRR